MVPPFITSPLAKAGVVNVTVPRLLPLIAPYLVSTSPPRDKVFVVAVMVPPVLERSILLADAARGSAKQINISSSTRLIKALLNLQVKYTPQPLSLRDRDPT